MPVSHCTHADPAGDRKYDEMAHQRVFHRFGKCKILALDTMPRRSKQDEKFFGFLSAPLLKPSIHSQSCVVTVWFDRIGCG